MEVNYFTVLYWFCHTSTRSPDFLTSCLPFWVLRMIALHIREENLGSMIILLSNFLLLNITGPALLVFYYFDIFLIPNVTWTFPYSQYFTLMLSICSISFTDLDPILTSFSSLSGNPWNALTHPQTALLDLWRKWRKKVKSLSRVRLSVTPWTADYQAPPSMGLSRQE